MQHTEHAAYEKHKITVKTQSVIVQVQVTVKVTVQVAVTVTVTVTVSQRGKLKKSDDLIFYQKHPEKSYFGVCI